MRVIRRHHPLYGREFEVLMEGKQRVTLRLENGTSMHILREWTDADGKVDLSPRAREGIYTVESLRRLFALIDALTRR